MVPRVDPPPPPAWGGERRREGDCVWQNPCADEAKRKGSRRPKQPWASPWLATEPIPSGGGLQSCAATVVTPCLSGPEACEIMRNRPPTRGVGVGVGSPLCSWIKGTVVVVLEKTQCRRKHTQQPLPAPSGCGGGDGHALRPMLNPASRCLGKRPDKRSLRGGRPGSGECRGCHRVGLRAVGRRGLQKDPSGDQAQRQCGRPQRKVCWKEPGVPSGMPVTLCCSWLRGLGGRAGLAAPVPMVAPAWTCPPPRCRRV